VTPKYDYYTTATIVITRTTVTTTTTMKKIKNLIEFVQLVDGVIEGLLGDLARLILEL
jgi:hypothetical protein